MNQQLIQAIIIAAISSSGLSSLIVFLIQRWDKKKSEKQQDKSATTRMLFGLGHDKLIFLTDKYVRRGAITLVEKRNLDYIYKPYRDLNGNGDCEIGYKACEKLPVVSEEEASAMDAAIKRREYGLEDDEQSI